VSARVEAAKARRNLQFLEECTAMCDRLEEAKEAVRAARAAGDAKAMAKARKALRPIATEVHEFRAAMVTLAGAPEAGPGDAVVRPKTVRRKG
jgi:hypothetical protein